MPGKRKLERMLPRAGRGLPRAKRAEELRRSVLESVGVDVDAVDAESGAGAGAKAPRAAAVKKPVYRSRGFLVGAVAVCVVAALAVCGGLSLDAMPGDLLYPVKRMLQRTRSALAFGAGDRATVDRANARARLDELEYARSKDMEEWYAPLARSATSDLTRSIQSARSSEEAEEAKETLERIKDISGEVDPDDTDLQEALDDVEKQINRKFEQSF